MVGPVAPRKRIVLIQQSVSDAAEGESRAQQVVGSNLEAIAAPAAVC